MTRFVPVSESSSSTLKIPSFFSQVVTGQSHRCHFFILWSLLDFVLELSSRDHSRCSCVSLECPHISSQWPGRDDEPSHHDPGDKCLIDECRTILKEIPEFSGNFYT